MSTDAIVAKAKNEANLKKLAEGKTKQIFAIAGENSYVLVRSKDDLTAFNAQRHNVVEGKGKIANATTTNVFTYLKNVGFQSHFVAPISDSEILCKSCAMIPIEWVARRVATGSFLKRNPGVKEGYRFNKLCVETFFKDDANDDPQWRDEQILSAGFVFNGLKIGPLEVALMRRQTELVFRVLEKGWQLHGCALIDMKIEFGVTTDGKIVLADVIDNDSWRIWPSGDRRLQLDKQFYRDLKTVTEDDIKQLKQNYQRVADITRDFSRPIASRVVILMGSASDLAFCEKIAARARGLNCQVILRVSSAHKSTTETLAIAADYEGDGVPTVLVAVAGRSNGLGPVLAGNSTLPVVNAPPGAADWLANDIWSSLRTPAGLGCTTALGADEAGLAAAKILAQNDHMIFGKVLADQIHYYTEIYNGDKVAETK